uniref:ZAD domain-containing protein n=1 Tax=Cacopsylla melanoneura TaxID=428564 RepID=A0A8D9A7Z4_9HEMI
MNSMYYSSLDEAQVNQLSADIARYCRLCLLHRGTVDILSEEMMAKLFKLNIELVSKYKLPQKICKFCESTINTFYDQRETYEKNQWTLFKMMKTIDKTKESLKKCKTLSTPQNAAEYEGNMVACNEVYKAIMNSFGKKRCVVFECEPSKKDTTGVEVRAMGSSSDHIERNSKESVHENDSPIKRNANIDEWNEEVNTTSRNNNMENPDFGVDNEVSSFNANAAATLKELGLGGTSVKSSELGKAGNVEANVKTAGENRRTYGSAKDTRKTAGNSQDSNTSNSNMFGDDSRNTSQDDCVNTTNRDKGISFTSLTDDTDIVPDLFSVDVEDKLSVMPRKTNRQVVFLKRPVLNSFLTKHQCSFDGFEANDLVRTKWKLAKLETVHEPERPGKRISFVNDGRLLSYIGQESQGWLLDEPALELYIQENNEQGTDDSFKSLENRETEGQQSQTEEFEIKKEMVIRSYGKQTSGGVQNVNGKHSGMKPDGESNPKRSKKQVKNTRVGTGQNKNKIDQNKHVTGNEIERKSGEVQAQYQTQLNGTTACQEGDKKWPESDPVTQKPVRNLVEFLQVQKQSMSKLSKIGNNTTDVKPNEPN